MNKEGTEEVRISTGQKQNKTNNQLQQQQQTTPSKWAGKINVMTAQGRLETDWWENLEKQARKCKGSVIDGTVH